MKENKELLAVRKTLKKSKPWFVVKESKFSARVKSRWRYPRGKHSKVRQQHRGRPRLLNPGYGSPKAVRGFHPSGLLPVVVKTLDELNSIDLATQGVLISGKIGNRKRIELLTAAQEKKITILSSSNSEKLLKKLQDNFVERQKTRKKKETEKAKKTTEKKKVSEKKTQTKEEKSEPSIEEKTKEQKKAVEKTITKRQ